MRKITVGSRESVLAVVQARAVIDCLRAAHPELEIDLVTMKTTGDKILDRTLDKVGGKGLFVKELDTALREKRADITVHSLKDMPMETPLLSSRIRSSGMSAGTASPGFPFWICSGRHWRRSMEYSPLSETLIVNSVSTG